MTLEELMGTLVEHGFVRQEEAAPTEQETPPAEPAKPEQPDYGQAFADLRADIAALTKAIQANAISNSVMDVAGTQTAEDILGELLSGKKGEKKGEKK